MNNLRLYIVTSYLWDRSNLTPCHLDSSIDWLDFRVNYKRILIMKNTSPYSLAEFQRGHVDKLDMIVRNAIEEEELIVNRFAHPEKEKVSLSQKVADGITEFSGSMLFLILNGVFFIVWIILNTVHLGFEFFDPYPYGFLTMVVSLEAIFLSCFVLISQNRQAEKDRSQNESDYLVNLKAEIEVRSLHQKMDLLLEEQIETLYDTQAQQLKMLGEIKKKLKHHIPEKSTPTKK